MSVLVDTKSNRQRKTQKVEPGETGRKFEHLTRGELRGESGAAVSRGHSSKESGRKSEGAKDQRTKRQTNQPNSGKGAQKSSETGLERSEKIIFQTGREEPWRVELIKETSDGGRARNQANRGARRC